MQNDGCVQHEVVYRTSVYEVLNRLVQCLDKGGIVHEGFKVAGIMFIPRMKLCRICFLFTYNYTAIQSLFLQSCSKA